MLFTWHGYTMKIQFTIQKSLSAVDTVLANLGSPLCGAIPVESLSLGERGLTPAVNTFRIHLTGVQQKPKDETIS